MTIVHSGDMLFNDTYPASFRKYVAKTFIARGVKIVYGDYIDDFPTEKAAGVTTRNGKKLNADLVVSTRAASFLLRVSGAESFLSARHDGSSSEYRLRFKPGISCPQ